MYKIIDNKQLKCKFILMDRINLLGHTVGDLEQLMLSLGEKRFKGRQLFKWLYNIQQYDFRKMTDLSLELREKLSQKYFFAELTAEEMKESSDGTEKFLFRLDDGAFIETVLIPDRDKRTVCLSSQAGCALNCGYCATGRIGFGRHLSTGEIVGQLLHLRRRNGADAFHNIVFMGMGEPLLNYENMCRSIEIISSEIGLSVSARRITVSTAGIVPGINQLADSGLKVNLAISLNAATDEKRSRLMPIARKYNLKNLMEAARYFAHRRKKRVTFEYIIFAGFNDSRQDALDLARLIQGIPCKINILAYNPVEGLPYRRPSPEAVDNFARILYPRAPAVTVRKSRGLDIEAACGQLAGKKVYKKIQEKKRC
jgi:23S rRNA (adenine2503-C2)-methyltransferase